MPKKSEVLRFRDKPSSRGDINQVKPTWPCHGNPTGIIEDMLMRGREGCRGIGNHGTELNKRNETT